MSNTKKVFKNTAMLYVRQLVILFVGLYTVRIVLDVLGVEDYGIYSVIGGVVSLLSFLSTTLTSSTQRFFSYALGENNSLKLRQTFTVSWVMYLLVGLFAGLILETGGLWFVSTSLDVPPERFEAAQLIFQFSILAFFVSFVKSPFNAMIIAHEDMHVYAYISILEALLKLVAVYLLDTLVGDKLEIYGLLVLLVNAVVSLIYILYCLLKYEECQFKVFYWDRSMAKNLVGFTGWTLFGQISNVARIQSITILLNQMFNPAIVAARAVSINITGNIKLFSNNFNVGLYPSIIKSYASNNKEEMFSLVFNGSKIAFFLMWVFALPLYLEMEFILNFWLKNPPPMAVLFTRLALIEVIINTLSLPMATAARAPGRMKVYELSLGSIQIAIFFVSWLFLSLGYPAYTVFVIAIFANLLMFIVRLFIVNSLIGLSVIVFLKKVAYPVLLVIVFSSVPSFILHHYIPEGILPAIVSIISSIGFSTISMYFIALDKEWRQKVVHMIKSKISR